MTFKNTLNFLIASLILLTTENHADTLGKIEAAASYIHIDLIEAKNTIKEIDMPGIRVEGAYSFDHGVYLKPCVMYAKKNESELISAGASLGICIPYRERFLVSPSLGVNYTKLNTKIDLEFGNGILITAHETFEGWAPYLGLEITYRIRKDLRLSLSGQYAWSRSETDIKKILRSKSDSSGPAYGVMLEYDFTDCWSVNIGAAYNESYSRERNGIRGRGGKIGLVRWF
jgi:hypothetical protein